MKSLSGKTVTLEINGMATTIDEVKLKLRDKEGIPPNHQRLTFAGKELIDGTTLSEYGIESGATLELRLRMYSELQFIFAAFDVTFPIAITRMYRERCDICRMSHWRNTHS